MNPKTCKFEVYLAINNISHLRFVKIMSPGPTEN